jgi:hypothetical protein
MDGGVEVRQKEEEERVDDTRIGGEFVDDWINLAAALLAL